MTERTLSIIKPDAVAAGKAGAILKLLEDNGFKIVALKMVRLTQSQAEGFYAVHRERPFFASLTKFMTEGPVIPMILERENAIAKLREVMGATDPSKAARARSANSLPRPSSAIAFTALTLWKRRASRQVTSSTP